MSLFGPNIGKMKRNGDVEGLASLLQADNLQRRVEATEALLELGDDKGLQLLTKRYEDIFKFGNAAHKVELMMLLQGSYIGINMTLAWVGPIDPQMAPNLLSAKSIRKMDLGLVQPILSGAATNLEENPVVRLCALVTLAELGDRTDNVRELLVDFLTSEMIQHLNIYNVEETVKVLRHFSNEPSVADLLMKIHKGEIVRAEETKGIQEAAISALGHSTLSSAREYTDYWDK